jgi:ABC-2 type transport system ATP-binding protein
MTGRTGSPSAIEAIDLTKRYGGTLAVDHLSFSVPPGQVTGFLGPNGSGKSTTMRMIVGLDRPDEGSVSVGGRPYQRVARPLRMVGALLDARAVHPGRSARDHLLSVALSNGIGRRRVDELLELVGLAAVAQRRVGGFSLGMCQRLGIAGALLGDPPVLLFDEPVNGLDADGVRWVRTLLRGFAAEGRTVLLASHLMSEMALTADRLIVIGRGRLLREAPIDDLLRSPDGTRVRVQSPDAQVLATVLNRHGATVEQVPPNTLRVAGLTIQEVGAIAAGQGLALTELSEDAVSLEEAYLALTGDTRDYRAAPTVNDSTPSTHR